MDEDLNIDGGAGATGVGGTETGVALPNDGGAVGSEPGAGHSQEDPHAASKAFLDSLTEGAPDVAGGGSGAAAVVVPDGGSPQAGQAPGAQAPGTPAQPGASAAAAPVPKTPEQEEAELLDGIRSERGRDRIRQKFAELKEKDAALKERDADLTEFRTMVLDSYGDPQEFARVLEFGRLIKSGDESNLRTALGMLDQQRAELALRLGIDAPGVDPLADFPDLKKAVEDLAITREHAVSLAKYQRQERQQTAQRQAAQQQEQQRAHSQQAFEQEISTLSTTATKYFETRAQEVDYPAKMKAIHEYFGNPQNVRDFVSTYEPRQWMAQFRFMYDNIRIAPSPRPSAGAQPLRTRPAHAGIPSGNPSAAPADRIMGVLEGMGI